MADLSDVSNTLVALIASVLYPNGSSRPSALGIDARIFVGWPLPAQLDADLAKNVCQVSVYPSAMNRNTTRYMDQWQPASVNTPTLALTLAGQTVTVSGTVPPANNPHNLVMFVGGVPYVYQAVPSDTLASIAAALAAQINAAVPGTSSAGPVITVPAPAEINTVRVGVTGTGVMEIRRQEQLYQIGIWAPTPTARDAIAKAIDPVLASTFRLTLPDGSSCRLIWKNSLQSDQAQKANLYRRDLFYSAEFPTLDTETETQITQQQLNTGVAIAGVYPTQPVTTIYE